MARLKLKADTPYERAILRYLEANASEALEEKINNGNKTLAQCWKYITSEAKKEAKNGCAMIEDQKVYGWAIHFFEEDEIKAEAHESPSESTNDTPEERPAPKKAAPVAKGAVENQMSFDDLFG